MATNLFPAIILLEALISGLKAKKKMHLYFFGHEYLPKSLSKLLAECNLLFDLAF